MTKTLFVNGCSWTYGGGLDEPGTKENITNLHNNVVWSAHVRDLLKFDTCVNLAEGCGSNQRICRTTFDWVNQQDEEILKNTTVIIQWSHEDRYEYYVPTEEEKSDFQKRYQVTPALEEDINPKIKNANYSLFKISPQATKGFAGSPGLQLHRDGHHWAVYTQIEAVSATDNVLMVISQCQATQIQLIHCLQLDADSDVLTATTEIQDYIYNNFPMLEDDDNRCHHWQYDRIGGDPFDSHPNDMGHLQLANYIIDAIAKKKTILRRP